MEKFEGKQVTCNIVARIHTYHDPKRPVAGEDGFHSCQDPIIIEHGRAFKCLCGIDFPNVESLNYHLSVLGKI